MKYTLVNPSKPKSFSHSNVFTIKVKCKIDDCLNLTFGTLDKCALHCEKGSYRTDWYNSLLSEFTSLLNNYILNYFIDDYYNYKSTTQNAQLAYELKVYLSNSRNLYESAVIETYFRDTVIVFSGIKFPTRDSRDAFDYFKTLKMFKGIYLTNCSFYLGDWNIENIEFFFEDCCFEKEFSITSLKVLDDLTNSLFSECIFKEKTIIVPNETNSCIENILFSGCDFKNELVICDLIFKEKLFNDEDGSPSKFSNLTILSSIFEKNIELNALKINELCVEDTEFQSKFEIKETTVKALIFKNSNVEKVFDAFESKFEKLYFYQSTFKDFSGFEKVEFGLEGKNIEAYQAKFIDTNFMSFSNFRNTKFLSGLDFSTVNLKQEPNFLKTYVHPKGTDRETFRIIKNSFEKSNNKIEAGNYHTREMNAYIKELNFHDNFWQLIVLHANNLISRFGQSYIIPFLLLVGCIALYSYLLNSYQETLQFRNYEMQYGIEEITEWLNTGARNFLPFARFISDKRGFEFVSLIFYIAFAILTWQTIVAVKKQTQH